MPDSAFVYYAGVKVESSNFSVDMMYSIVEFNPFMTEAVVI